MKQVEQIERPACELDEEEDGDADAKHVCFGHVRNNTQASLSTVGGCQRVVNGSGVQVDTENMGLHYGRNERLNILQCVKGLPCCPMILFN